MKPRAPRSWWELAETVDLAGWWAGGNGRRNWRQTAQVLEVTDGELKEKEAMVSLGQSREGKFSVMEWSGGRRQGGWGWQLQGNGAKIPERSRRGEAGVVDVEVIQEESGARVGEET